MLKVYVLMENRCHNGDDGDGHYHEPVIYAIYKNEDTGQKECSRLIAGGPRPGAYCKPSFKLQTMVVVEA